MSALTLFFFDSSIVIFKNLFDRFNADIIEIEDLDERLFQKYPDFFIFTEFTYCLNREIQCGEMQREKVQVGK